MKLMCLGATHEVTGSCHYIEACGKTILLDCGMEQGQESYENQESPVPADAIDYVFLSHAHIDHSGLVPRLVKDGFRGKIFATPATTDLAEILLLNSADIQKSDTIFLNKRRAKEGKPPLEPLYTDGDVKHAMSLFHQLEINTPLAIDEDIELTLYEVGHIIGSATVFLKLKEDGATRTLAFSGDVGRYGDPILYSPQAFPQVDYMIVESTYGDKNHDVAETYASSLKRHITSTCLNKGGKLIIPAFSVGRTQELLFALNELENKGELPAIDYFVDSPLSIEATEIVKKHPECFNKSVHKLMLTDYDPFLFNGLRYVQNVEESKRLNDYKRPCVIISASGMAEAGRVKHHIANSIGLKRNTILLVGYCEPQSLGARLKQMPEEVTIYGERFKVRADIETIDSMSAHADYNDLSQYLSCQDPAEVEKIFIVHGEPEVQEVFRNRLLKKGFRDVIIPKRHEEIGLG